jgi:hypothetical protein
MNSQQLFCWTPAGVKMSYLKTMKFSFKELLTSKSMLFFWCVSSYVMCNIYYLHIFELCESSPGTTKVRHRFYILKICIFFFSSTLTSESMLFFWWLSFEYMYIHKYTYKYTYINILNMCKYNEIYICMYMLMYVYIYLLICP